MQKTRNLQREPAKKKREKKKNLRMEWLVKHQGSRDGCDWSADTMYTGGFLAKRRTSPTRDDMDVLLARSMRDAFLVLPPLRQTGYYIHTHVRSTLTLVGDGRHACTPKRKFIHHQSQSQECNYPRPMSLGV